MKYIYFARRTDGEGPIKIGCSCAPSVRVGQLGFDLSMTFDILTQAPGDFTLERNLHHKFRDLRTTAPKREGRDSVPGETEWFEAAPNLLKFIEKVRVAGEINLWRGERLEEIFAARYRAGESLRSIGADFGLSHERVRQVLNQHGCTTNRREAA